MLRAIRATVVLLVLGMLAAPAADAQWITLGRKALGKVREMSQSEKTDGPGYSVATVLVAGEVEKVYATALKTVQSSPRLRLTKQVPEKHTLEFADGTQIVGLEVSQVDEKVVHLLIASVTTPGRPDETSIAAAAALRICKEMGGNCSLAKSN